MNYVPNLGETPGADARRDAVHVPVIPLTAGETLRPGDFFHVCQGLAYQANAGVEEAVGYVDPLLRRRGVQFIPGGGRFWGCILPNTVTSLRHVWTHPAFQTKLPEGGP